MTDYLRYIRSSKEGKLVVQLAHQREEMDFVEGMPKEDVVKRLREMAARLEGEKEMNRAEKEIAAVMALAEFYARAYYRWNGAAGSYQSMVDAKAKLYDHLANTMSTGVLQESPHASPHAGVTVHGVTMSAAVWERIKDGVPRDYTEEEFRAYSAIQLARERGASGVAPSHGLSLADQIEKLPAVRDMKGGSMHPDSMRMWRLGFEECREQAAKLARTVGVGGTDAA